jgi:starch synthase (maltosyl-transferring)
MQRTNRQAASAALPEEGRRRVVIEGVKPEIDGGRYPVKRVMGDRFVVEADAFTDGHDRIAALLLYRHESEAEWREAPLALLVNDRWRGEFQVTEPGFYVYTVTAWADRFLSWRHDLERREDAEDIMVALQVGASLAEAAAKRASGEDRKTLQAWARKLRDAKDGRQGRFLGLAEEFSAVMTRHPDRHLATEYDRELRVWVDRERARFSTWYEMFPRSCLEDGQRHGSFKACEARLPYIAEMGFDVLYLPPIHPVGLTKRKGPNNALIAGSNDPGSPWAIGAEDGGHKGVHSQLGTLEDFRRLVDKAGALGIEVALDIAYQCSPDHPYVREHPEWFQHRPDGSIQYAENPPKKYQDVYPFDFETEGWQPLWRELKSVFDFWIGAGVKIFRVDNPHTKPFPFWEWAIAQLRAEHPDLIFLAEAFTRPKVMYRLAKLGYTQSYTYFAWRNTKQEITDYFTELTRAEVREYFRPNLWPNTPDILTEYLQYGGRPAFMVRAALAATLGASYGIYGPAFELFEGRAREPGSEEYLDSEKYQLRHWDIERPDSLREFMARLNRVRRENPALQQDWNLRFFPVDNDALIAYGKFSDDQSNFVLAVVNLDPHNPQAGWLELPVEELGLAVDRAYQMHDLLSGARYLWHGRRNYVRLDPSQSPAHVFRLRRRVRTERDFDYFL